MKTREWVMLREATAEAEVKAAHERAFQAEERSVIVEWDLANDLADVSLDGYDELRQKISSAFPDIDVSGFMPTETEVPDNGDGGSGEAKDEAKVEEEEGEDDHESS